MSVYCQLTRRSRPLRRIHFRSLRELATPSIGHLRTPSYMAFPPPVTYMKRTLSALTSESNLGARLVLSFGLLIAIVICLGLVGLKHVRADAELEKTIDARWRKVQLSREALAFSNLNNRITMQVFLIEDENEIDTLLKQRSKNTKEISGLVQTLVS